MGDRNLFSIEKKLGEIAETEQKIPSFLEAGQEAEVEADVGTLLNIITQYKHNWDNQRFLENNHKMALDIQRNARKNMLAYQKQVKEILQSKQLIVVQTKVNPTSADLQSKFKYYRLSLYTYSMASLTEIILGGNFKEDYIAEISNPGIGVFIEKLNDMIQIYNHTTEICFDDNRILLIAG